MRDGVEGLLNDMRNSRIREFLEPGTGLAGFVCRTTDNCRSSAGTTWGLKRDRWPGALRAEHPWVPLDAVRLILVEVSRERGRYQRASGLVNLLGVSIVPFSWSMGPDGLYYGFAGTKAEFFDLFQTDPAGRHNVRTDREKYSASRVSEHILALEFMARNFGPETASVTGGTPDFALLHEQDGFVSAGVSRFEFPRMLCWGRLGSPKLREASVERLALDLIKRRYWPVKLAGGTTLFAKGEAEACGNVVRFESRDEDRLSLSLDAAAVEERLGLLVSENFGETVSISLRPAVPAGVKTVVRSGMPVFEPDIPPEEFGDWTTLERRIGRPAARGLKYLAALTTAENVGGIVSFDANLVSSENPPLLCMEESPAIQKVRLLPGSMRLDGVVSVNPERWVLRSEAENGLRAERTGKIRTKCPPVVVVDRSATPRSTLQESIAEAINRVK